MSQNSVWSQFPSQIKYIIGNEACERFSYYGMRSILVVFMIQSLGFLESDAKGTYHLFVSAAYFLPLLGAYIADRYLGKYKTIMILSVVYCMGHGVLALFETKMGLYVGLGLIAIGAGGIKPCVSANVGDQFNSSNKHLLNKVFDLFYFSINTGSVISTLLIPYLYANYGSGIAFGVPGILMAVATIIFWMGRNQYVHVPPSKKSNQAGVLTVAYALLTNKAKATQKFSKLEIEGTKAVFGVLRVFLAVSMFWAIWEQQGSTWVLQAKKMNLTFMGITWLPSQIHTLNPILILSMIPLFSLYVYPWIERKGIKVTPLRKMGAGMVLTILAFVMSAIIEFFLNNGVQLNVGWQILPYIAVTAAEILISIPGLEFAYTQAPVTLKSTLMSLYLLAISIGNLLTAVVSYLNKFHGVGEYLFYAGMMALVLGVFIWIATNYQERNFLADETNS
jgi:POT family proton-dependent oligopeptide transporter